MSIFGKLIGGAAGFALGGPIGLIIGVALWARWGFAIAFEAIRTYCF